MGTCSHKPAKKETHTAAATTSTATESKPERQKTNFDLNEYNLEEVNRDNCLNMMDILFVLDTTGSMSSYI